MRFWIGPLFLGSNGLGGLKWKQRGQCTRHLYGLGIHPPTTALAFRLVALSVGLFSRETGSGLAAVPSRAC